MAGCIPKVQRKPLGDGAMVVLGIIVVVVLGGLSIVASRYYDPNSFRSRDTIRNYENEPIMKELAEIKELLKNR